VDVDAAVQLIQEFTGATAGSGSKEPAFSIIKHTNVCGIAIRPTLKQAWDAALAGDPESAFGGVLACNVPVDKATATAIHEIFFEVLIAPASMRMRWRSCARKRTDPPPAERAPFLSQPIQVIAETVYYCSSMTKAILRSGRKQGAVIRHSGKRKTSNSPI